MTAPGTGELAQLVEEAVQRYRLRLHPEDAGPLPPDLEEAVQEIARQLREVVVRHAQGREWQRTYSGLLAISGVMMKEHRRPVLGKLLDYARERS